MLFRVCLSVSGAQPVWCKGLAPPGNLTSKCWMENLGKVFYVPMQWQWPTFCSPLNLCRWFFSTRYFKVQKSAPPRCSDSKKNYTKHWPNPTSSQTRVSWLGSNQVVHKSQMLVSLSPASNSPSATCQGASARWHADKAALNVPF